MKKDTAKNILKKRKIDTTKYVSLTIIAIMLLVTYLPILVLVVYSFTSSHGLGTWNGFTLGLYRQVFTNERVMMAMANSLIIAGASSVLATFLGTATAVGIFYMRKMPKTIVSGVSRITAFNAPIVTGVGFMLLFTVINFPQSLEGYLTIIIAHTVICTPFVILSVMPRLTQLNPNVYEAGLDLGATHTRTFFTVVMPQLISGMISGFMIAFVISLDDFIVLRFIKGDVDTIPSYILERMRVTTPPYIRAVGTLILAVSLTLLIIVNILAYKRNKKLKQQD